MRKAVIVVAVVFALTGVSIYGETPELHFERYVAGPDNSRDSQLLWLSDDHLISSAGWNVEVIDLNAQSSRIVYTHEPSVSIDDEDRPPGLFAPRRDAVPLRRSLPDLGLAFFWVYDTHDEDVANRFAARVYSLETDSVYTGAEIASMSDAELRPLFLSDTGSEIAQPENVDWRLFEAFPTEPEHSGPTVRGKDLRTGLWFEYGVNFDKVELGRFLGGGLDRYAQIVTHYSLRSPFVIIESYRIRDTDPTSLDYRYGPLITTVATLEDSEFQVRSGGAIVPSAIPLSEELVLYFGDYVDPGWEVIGSIHGDHGVGTPAIGPMSRTGLDDVLDPLATADGFVMTAVPRNSLALHPDGERFAAFGWRDARYGLYIYRIEWH